MNTAVLMLSACLAGAGQAPAVPPGYAPYPAQAYPAQAYPAPVYPAPAYPAYQGAPVVVANPGQSYGGECCGHASVCGDCDGCAHKCCLLDKLKSKLSCIHIDLCGCGKGCDTCGKGHSVCDKGCAPACPKPACPPCPKPVCAPCPKPVCCKAETVCHGCCTGCCWTPGYFLHKCKEKLGCCDKSNGCHGGCGTACTPNACGSTVIAPAGPNACGSAVIPPAVAPVNPVPVTQAPPESRKMPEKVGSNYGPVQTTQPTATSAPRTIDLGAAPF